MVAPWAHQESCGRVRCAGDTTSQCLGTPFQGTTPFTEQGSLSLREEVVTPPQQITVLLLWLLTNLDRRREHSLQGWDAGTVPDS